MLLARLGRGLVEEACILGAVGTRGRKKGGTLPLGTPAAVSRKKGGTLPLGTPAAVSGRADEEPRSEDREALMLPPDLSDEEREVRSKRSDEIARDSPEVKRRPVSVPPPGHDRPSRRSRLSSWAGVGQRTSLAEIADRSGGLARLTIERLTRTRFAYRTVVAVMASSLVLLVVALGVSLGQWRFIPIGLLFLNLAATLGYHMMHSLLPRLARRFGEVALPGRAGMYLALFASAVVSVAGLLTWGVSKTSAVVGRAVIPRIAAYVPIPVATVEASPAPPPATAEPAPKLIVRQWHGHLWVKPGLLFMPSSFQPEDGKFDVILHFHGNTELVQKSVEEAKLNALVHITNFAGSEAYQERLAIPGTFDEIIAKIEKRASEQAGTELKVRRVALSSWSAGYGALHSLLNDESVFSRIDAVLVLDGIHGGFVPDGTRTVHPSVVAPFVKFAKEATAGKRLMVITHSAIETADYASSTETASAILAAVGANREPVDASQSPPPMEFREAVEAFPIREVKWLKIQSKGELGDLHVFGYTGQDKSDHIAHLAQMSVTVLPWLKRRWQ